MDEYLDSNRSLWDGWATLNNASRFYDVAGFRQGASSLKDIEVETVGNVLGQELLHLQCHIGLDTLSWARRGARVTGVDFSEKAVSIARSLANDLAIPAEFRCSEVTELPSAWSDRFDLVFSSYGVLPWLPDLSPWASTIQRVLRPGGSLYLIEFHPFAAMLGDDGHFAYPYFHSATPLRQEVNGSYADPGASFSHASFEWAHTLSDLFSALTSAGLTICQFREYPYCPFGCFPCLEEKSTGRWTVRGAPVDVPLVFSVSATK
jgi:ubiquinone/menaquinone biosynthesis C-methylase UbiE